MIQKNSNWELGAYLHEYNGNSFSSVDILQPINLLSKNFLGQCTKAYVNEKFFYYDITKENHFLKCNVEFILRFFISLRTDNNNTIHSLTGYYANPLLFKYIVLPDIQGNTVAGTQLNYRTGIYHTAQPISVADKGSSFFIATAANDSVTLINNAYGFLWTVMLRQI